MDSEDENFENFFTLETANPEDQKQSFEINKNKDSKLESSFGSTNEMKTSIVQNSETEEPSIIFFCFDI